MTDPLALPNAAEAMTIAAMFAATYSTRTIGWLLLRNRKVSPPLRRALDAAPGAVMAAIVAPQFMTTDPVKLASLAVATLVAVKTKNMAAAVLVSMAAFAGLRALLQVS